MNHEALIQILRVAPPVVMVVLAVVMLVQLLRTRRIIQRARDVTADAERIRKNLEASAGERRAVLERLYPGVRIGDDGLPSELPRRKLTAAEVLALELAIREETKPSADGKEAGR